ncbi:MAG: hypothetical protein H5U13_03005 [Parvibaculum sp.]|nr:hypothetical protein [Parvibaculum sp.]
MRWLRLQIPVLYLASVMLATVLQCVPASAAQMPAAHHAAATHRHEGHGHSTPLEQHGSHPCHGSDLTCLCDRADVASLVTHFKSRDLPEAKVLIQLRWQTPDTGLALQPSPSVKPPENRLLRKRAYTDAYRRSGRLLI